MGDNTYEQVAQSLEVQYRLLDPALIRALLYEYDHNDAEQSRALHETLETLLAEAAVDDASAFDPSGTSGVEDIARSSPGKSKSEGHTESGVTTSSDTDLTNLSYGLEKIDVRESYKRKTSADLAADEASLLELFPSQTEANISFTLKKCGGDFDRAVDILLNHVYFDDPTDGEERVSLKSIDAFEQSANPQKKRKGKKKDNKLSTDSAWSCPEISGSSTPPKNHWQSAAENIDFLATRTHLAPKLVQWLYNKHGASVPATITAIIAESPKTHGDATSIDPMEEVNIAMLASEFDAIPLSTIAGLIRLTAPSTAHAHELAKALIAPPAPSASENVALVGRKLLPQYAPLRIDEGSAVASPSSSTQSLTSPTALSASALSDLRAKAFGSASQYYRKAGSDRNFGGAAAYYGQLGRDYNSKLRAATSAEADAHVAAQSSETVIDLHGVSVADAVRIAEIRTQRWWDAVRVKEGRSNSERIGEGFVIVTGRGVHSKGGHARIGPAVTRALMNSGWKIEVRVGEVVVFGRSKK